MSDLLTAVTKPEKVTGKNGKGPEPRKYSPTKFANNYGDINWHRDKKIIKIAAEFQTNDGPTKNRPYNTNSPSPFLGACIGEAIKKKKEKENEISNN